LDQEKKLETELLIASAFVFGTVLIAFGLSTQTDVQTLQGEMVTWKLSLFQLNELLLQYENSDDQLLKEREQVITKFIEDMHLLIDETRESNRITKQTGEIITFMGMGMIGFAAIITLRMMLKIRHSK